MSFGPTGELIGLFASAFLAATLLPGGSEAALAAILALGASEPWIAIALATVGNTLGSLVNWAIGRFLSGYRDHPRFPIPAKRFEAYVERYQRWGAWLLLLSWVPVVGDPLTVVSGVLRTPLPVFLAVVAAAKLARYLVVAGAVSLF